MKSFPSPIGSLLPAVLAAGLLVLGTGAAVHAEGGGGGHHGEKKCMQGGHGKGGGQGEHGKGGGHGDHGKGGGRHGAGQGGCGRHGKGGGHRDHEPAWRSALSEEQKTRLQGLRLERTRATAPRQARIKALEVELAVLAVSGQADPAEVGARLGDIAELERGVRQAEYDYLAAVRSLLDTEQQGDFDMWLIRRALDQEEHPRGRH
jgi:hypothetical protein